jgi:hypothetical protein
LPHAGWLLARPRPLLVSIPRFRSGLRLRLPLALGSLRSTLICARLSQVFPPIWLLPFLLGPVSASASLRLRSRSPAPPRLFRRSSCIDLSPVPILFLPRICVHPCDRVIFPYIHPSIYQYSTNLSPSSTASVFPRAYRAHSPTCPSRIRLPRDYHLPPSSPRRLSAWSVSLSTAYDWIGFDLADSCTMPVLWTFSTLKSRG